MPSTFLQGLQRVLNCSKAQVATAGLATTWLAVRYAAIDLPPTQRTSLWVAFVGAVAVALREVINAWTEEDVARAAGLQPETTNPPATTQPARIAPTQQPAIPATTNTPPAPPTITRVTTTKPLTQTPLPQRSPTMPLRTKLPILLLALASLTTTSGCQSPPELAIYREGLHRIDEPLYQAHLLLMDDAVKANIRTDADRQVVQQGIAGARAMYEESSK